MWVKSWVISVMRGGCEASRGGRDKHNFSDRAAIKIRGHGGEWGVVSGHIRVLVIRTLASDGSRQITWLEHRPLIGRKLDTWGLIISQIIYNIANSGRPHKVKLCLGGFWFFIKPGWEEGEVYYGKDNKGEITRCIVIVRENPHFELILIIYIWLNPHSSISCDVCLSYVTELKCKES